MPDGRGELSYVKQASLMGGNLVASPGRALAASISLFLPPSAQASASGNLTPRHLGRESLHASGIPHPRTFSALPARGRFALDATGADGAANYGSSAIIMIGKVANASGCDPDENVRGPTEPLTNLARAQPTAPGRDRPALRENAISWPRSNFIATGSRFRQTGGNPFAADRRCEGVDVSELIRWHLLP